ncbi:hypothetical protein OQA88_10076 [Cercophora sp. LCS_1]
MNPQAQHQQNAFFFSQPGFPLGAHGGITSPAPDDINHVIHGEPFDHFMKKHEALASNNDELRAAIKLQVDTADEIAKQTMAASPEMVSHLNSGPISRLSSGRCVNNQSVLFNMNPEVETFIPAGLFVAARGFTWYTDGILCSEHYPVSMITLDTLIALKYSVAQAKMKVVMNPRGGQFRPLGVARLYVKFVDDPRIRMNTEPGFFVNFLVVDKSSEETGFMLVIGGRHDIDRRKQIIFNASTAANP